MNDPKCLLQSTRRRINLFLDSFSTNIHTCAFHLGNALLSKSRFSTHIKFLSTCLRDKIVPNGFQIRKSVNVKCRNFNAVVSRLNQCSRQLMRITLESNRHCVNIYDQSMKKRLGELRTLCSDSQFRIIRQFLHNCHCEYYDFLSLHKRSKLEKLRPSKPLRPSPMDDKLVVTIPKDLPLSSSEMSILKQGLSFIPTPHNVDEYEIRCDFEKFARRMRLFAHFDDNPIKDQSKPCKDNTTYTFNDPFEFLKPKTSSWTPAEGQHPSLDVFISKCRIDINNILSNHVTSMHSNTSSEDRNAIKRLQERKDIVIKAADKGGAIVVWRRDLYLQEAIRQFSNTDLYIPLKTIQLLINKILSLLPLQN